MRHHTNENLTREEELKLYLTVQVEQITDVKDLSLLYVAKVKFTVKWFDVQVKYINLADNATRNFLDENEINKLWMPKIVLSNSQKVTPTVPDVSTVIYVEKRMEGESRIYAGQYRRALYYEGSANPLTLSKIDQTGFFCSFDYHWFPFDTQECEMKFKTFDSMKEFVNIVPENVSYSGDKELLIFDVISCTFRNISQETDEAVVMIRWDFYLDNVFIFD